jgi:uncharacterized protein
MELWHLSASDLVGHLNCRYLTSLDLAVAKGELDKPSVWAPVLDLLAERGALHEQSYLDYLEANGLPVTRIDGVGINTHAVAQTIDAMRGGAPVIAQGALQVTRWGGRVDILRRLEKPSALRVWSYEVIDTKLARETKGNTVLQICLYSDLLAEAQELAPEFAYVVTPGSGFKPQKFRYMPPIIAGSGIAWNEPLMTVPATGCIQSQSRTAKFLGGGGSATPSGG